MQLISNIFLLLTILTKNINIEQKLLNNLFYFNIKQQKIVLSIKYVKKLNFSIIYEKGKLGSFIPFGSIKSSNPYRNKKNDFIYQKNNNDFSVLKKYDLGAFGQKTKINYEKKNLVNKLIPIKKRNSNVGQFINKSRQILFKEENYMILKIIELI